jgi:hypothetical protein
MQTDNCNVSIQSVSGQLMALTETAAMWAVSELNMSSLASIDIASPLLPTERMILATAHILHHVPTHSAVRVYTRIDKGFSHAYDVIVMPDDIAALPPSPGPGVATATVRFETVLGEERA